MQRTITFIAIIAIAAGSGLGIAYFTFLNQNGISQASLNPRLNISPASSCNNNGTVLCPNQSNGIVKIKITSPANSSRVASGTVEVNGTIYGNIAGSFLTRPNISLIVDGVPAGSNQVPVLATEGLNGTGDEVRWHGNVTIPRGVHTLTAAIASPQETVSSNYSIIVDASSVKHSRTGIYIPLYSISNLGPFLKVIEANPGIQYLVSINPSSGPGSSVDSRFVNAIATLHSSGLNVTVIGYVPTAYGTGRTISNVEGMIYTWYSLYPNIDGIMFDEVSSSASTDSFYKTITDYARAHGAHFLRGNPGGAIDVGKVGMFDTIAIGESGKYPSQHELQVDTYNGIYGNTKFSYTVHDQKVLDRAWLTIAENYLGYVYITNDGEPNPYDTVPSYFAEEVSALTGLE